MDEFKHEVLHDLSPLTQMRKLKSGELDDSFPLNSSPSKGMQPSASQLSKSPNINQKSNEHRKFPKYNPVLKKPEEKS
jgi:hypothetical protein